MEPVFRAQNESLPARLLSLLYPRHCPICGDIALPRGRLCCDACRSIPRPIGGPVCMKCGRPVSGEKEYCRNCLKKQPPFTRAYPLYPYNEVMKRSITEFKSASRPEYADWYAEAMFRQLGERYRTLSLTCVIPVPAGREKLKARGYNQADLVARRLAEKLSLPCCSDYLIRVRESGSGQSAGSARRRSSERGDFIVNTKSEAYGTHLKSVLLVDDVYRTGTTVSCCAEVLLAAGTAHVYVTTIAAT